MAPPKTAGPALSAGFLRHLGLETTDAEGRGRRSGVQNRKDQRKEARAKPQRQQGRLQHKPLQSRGSLRQQQDKRARPPPAGKPGAKPSPVRLVNPELEDDSIDEDDFDGFGEEEEEDDDDDDDDNDDDDGDDDDDDGFGGETDESDSGSDESVSKVPAASAQIASSRMRERLEQDDAEIAELERKLGLKGRKNLPQSFKDDGLDDLLESLGGGEAADAETTQKNKRKAEAAEWLQSKRQKAMGLRKTDNDNEDGDGGADDDDDDDDGTGASGVSDGDFSDFDGAEDDGDDDREQEPRTAPKRQRENPYVAPVSASTPANKYVPPALRRAQQGTDSEPEVVTRVRRQAHHLIARLSDANMLTILGEVEKLYRDNPRQYVTDAITDKLLEQIQIEGALSNNVTVLIAGFAMAVYMVKGTDFGAHFIQQNATLFKRQYETLASAEQGQREQAHSWAPASKVALNLLGLMAELYNFRMIGPNLIHDYIRMLLGSLTETNTELLLRVFETSGHRLRQDDPSALRDIVSLVQPAVVRAGGEKSLSARTRHMIDRITEIKKSDRKKQRDAESSGFGHADRIRKILGSLPTSRKLEAAGPLRVSLADIEQAGERGKWWLVGASWAGRTEPPAGADKSTAEERNDAAKAPADGGVPARSGGLGDHKAGDDKDDVLGSWGDDIADVEQLDLLAREQGMNTDARRSIFVTLLSASDSKDAHARLLRLGLNKYEKREIANVLIRCAGSEQHYNRYYALVARQVCSADRRTAWVFQASLWKLFRRMGEQMFGDVPDDDGADEADEVADLRRIVNTAKLYGYLIACGSLSLDILKCLNLIRLQTNTQMFVEVLLISLFEEAQAASKADGSSGSSGGSSLLRKRFRAVCDKEDLRRGLLYFIDKVVRKSALVEKQQAPGIAKACSRAQKVLRGSSE